MESLAQAPAKETLVFFASEIGRAHGRWVGSEPKVNAEYEVEIDIPGLLRWGQQIDATEQTMSVIFEQDGDTFIVGTLQKFDGRVAEVSLHNDVLLVEVEHVGCEVPCKVVIKTRDLRLFDADI